MKRLLLPTLAALAAALAGCQLPSLQSEPPPTSVEGLKRLVLPTLVFTDLGNEGAAGGDRGKELMRLDLHEGGPQGPVLQSTAASLWVRGQSSSGMHKKSYGLELRSSTNLLEHRNLPLAGLDEDNDFVLHASYADKSLLRNYTTYTLSNRIGLWAPAVRLVEAWGLPFNDGSPSSGYEGIYVIVDKVKIGPQRVNIASLTPADTDPDTITGGYILKIDKPGTTEWYPPGVSTGSLSVSEPNDAALNDAQRDYIRGYILDLEASFGDGTWRRYLDETSFADYFLMQELTRNIDGYRISTYMHKDRGKKLAAGPLWDFDIALGNADYGDNGNPDGWTDAYGWMLVQFLEEGWGAAWWWRPMLADPEFRHLLKQRWRLHRAEALSDQAIKAVLDDARTQLAPGLGRNYTRWNTLNNDDWPNVWPIPFTDTPEGEYTYADHFHYLKAWLLKRAAWMDSSTAWNALDTWGEAQ